MNLTSQVQIINRKFKRCLKTVNAASEKTHHFYVQNANFLLIQVIGKMMFVTNAFIKDEMRCSELYGDIERPAEKIWPA